ncbi:hypothetical protein [Kribbella sp. NPDC023855]|uniref:hypothetical protein n=1 Tax=Kribbella sp. NPDC023855 TaxID=3154698 RepID=UPI0033F8ED16
MLTLRLLARRRLAVLRVLLSRRVLCLQAGAELCVLRAGAGLRILRAWLCALRAAAGLAMCSRSMLTLRH